MLTEVTWMASILGNRTSSAKNRATETNRFTYPADLRIRCECGNPSGLSVFTRCFQQFMEAGLREVHSPQEIRGLHPFYYAVINTAKECGTLR